MRMLRVELRLLLATCVLLACCLETTNAAKSTELATKRVKRDFLEGAKDVIGKVLGVVTGPIGKLIGGLFGGGGDDGAEDRHREQMALMRSQHCFENCVGDWSPWTACTAQCGGGSMTRQRPETIPGDCGDGFECGKQLQQSASCNPGCSHGGTPSGGKCTCPPGRKGNCCNLEVRCNYPGRPANGDIDGNFPAIFGSVVTYSCDEGFSMNGEGDISCLATGKWTGNKPNCGSLTCSMPPLPANGDIINKADIYLYGQEIMYRCTEGYTLVGPETRQCTKFGQNAAWTGFRPLCVEASCGDPGYPLYGEITGGDFSLGGVVELSCSAGYRLIGSTTRTCRPSGTWSGHDTVCQPISCEAPVAPRNGAILPVKEAYVFGSYVTVRCDLGFSREGKQKLKCLASTESVIIGGGGVWDAEPPTCQAILCGDPGVPMQGAKDGSIYSYPQNVTYSCFTGYTLHGASKLHCDSTGTWSSPIPECIACPVNTYKTNTHLDSPCQSCPSNTHTVTPGSNSPDQCVCDHGYKADSDGDCQEILCSPLSAPPSGSMPSCENKLGSTCEATCDAGHVFSTGNSKRQCLEDGTWSGTDAACQACPINTYKGTELICIPCPQHSHTSGDAQSEEGCVCDNFYKGPAGGPCVDVNECELNGGTGPCSDLCTNKEGSYDCYCAIPGYIIDPLNKNVCILDKTCRNLTLDDAPKQGALVCHWYDDENSQQCGIRCNPGYEFPARVNNYEYCGPSSGYMWSHEERDEIIEPCIEELFPDFRMEADSFYLTSACADLSPAEQEEVKQNFADMLTEQGICMKRDTKVCDIANVGIICGKTRKRKRRDADGTEVEEDVSDVDINLNVKAHKPQDRLLDCDQICTMLRIPPSRCNSLCERTYKRFLKAAVLYSKRQLERLYKNPANANFAAAARTFESNGIETKNVKTECGVGMIVKNDLCMACTPGSFYAHGNCRACPVGFYQPLSLQLTCLPCPLGTTSKNEGATMCKVCAPGTFGLQCKSNCSRCEHGTCHPKTGECVCSSGWEGPACDIDTMGCTSSTCYPGVNCWDVKAPGTGFLCGACPVGTTGDGTFCEMIPFGSVTIS